MLGPSAGYHSPVCSITGDPIDRIVAAIDQLSLDLHGETAGPELAADMTARVAAIWLMLTALDPELARLTRRYTGTAESADGTPPP